MIGNGPHGWEAGQTSIVRLEPQRTCSTTVPEAFDKYQGVALLD